MAYVVGVAEQRHSPLSSAYLGARDLSAVEQKNKGVLTPTVSAHGQGCLNVRQAFLLGRDSAVLIREGCGRTLYSRRGTLPGRDESYFLAIQS